ncbi:hypothetical protein ACODYM_28905 [Burkholderia gladioli]|uniref:hypothetical protein n=1 Tax=Burkholderia gladioli TaxID=28095 RepID=UPI003B50E2D7
MNWVFSNEIEARAKVIAFHDGCDVDKMVERRARREFLSDKIETFKTMDELRDILRYLAIEADLI